MSKLCRSLGKSGEKAMASSAGGAANGLETPVFSLHTVTEQEAELLYNRGCAAIRNDVYDEAVDSFSKALEIRSVGREAWAICCCWLLGPFFSCSLFVR